MNPSIRMHRTFHTAFATALLAAAAFGQSAVDTRGVDHLALGKMWTFENPPLAYLEKEYGFKPDQKWLDSLRLGALRLGERENPWCSASFVSPQGLIMTNHHCVRDEVAKIQGTNDWVKGGFAAADLTDEVPIPNLTVQQLIGQEDITAQVSAGVEPGDDAAAIAKKIEANKATILAAADGAHPGTMHQVVALYQGAVYQLYRYRVYDDIRLVFAVNLQAAHFGGDPDNFTYPRWSIDFSFVRAYENNKPADTSANYFRWRQEGARENELVFVPGNPGQTNRLFTAAQLENQRDLEYPIQLEQWRDEMEVVRPYAQRIPQLMTTLLSIENSFKAVSGMLAGLHDAALMAKKTTNEAQFRAAIAADAAVAAKYGDVHDKIAELAAEQRDLIARVAFYSPGYSPHLEVALAIVRAVDATLDDDERASARKLAAGTETDMNPLIAALVPKQLERTQRWLRADDAFAVALFGTAPGARAAEQAADRLRRSQVADAANRTALLEGGADAVQKSDDYAIAVARALWPLLRDTEKRDAEVKAGLAEQGRRIGRALFAVYGSNVSPDATMTLRFSDGLVQGYEYNGTIAPWATTFYGLYGRAVEFGGRHPFDLAEPFVKAEPRIDLAKKVCFASTNDIVGGNSGSCMVDKDLQVVGLIFDGNIESLPNDFYYTQEKARAVSVHTDAIVESLQKVYAMGRLVEELRAGAK
ncbi:MAG TPA: S46 family peptidase [Planctomycetota bacterium]|nr:S46 family peptidase [Planctomycetota bacterium]